MKEEQYQSLGNVASVHDVELAVDSIKFKMVDHNRSTIKEYCVPVSLISGLILINEHDLIMSIVSTPKQVIYCDNKEQRDAIIDAFKSYLYNDVIECNSVRGDSFIFNPSHTTMHIKEGNTVIVCINGIDQHSKSSVLTQRVILKTEEEANTLCSQLEASYGL